MNISNVLPLFCVAFLCLIRVTRNVEQQKGNTYTVHIDYTFNLIKKEIYRSFCFSIIYVSLLIIVSYESFLYIYWRDYKYNEKCNNTQQINRKKTGLGQDLGL